VDRGILFQALEMDIEQNNLPREMDKKSGAVRARPVLPTHAPTPLDLRGVSLKEEHKDLGIGPPRLL
jgi:hypothetical protein